MAGHRAAQRTGARRLPRERVAAPDFCLGVSKAVTVISTMAMESSQAASNGHRSARR